MALGWPVAMSVDSGNLPAVARALKARHPQVRLMVAGDDDPEAQGNPGRTKAEAAAQAVNGYTVFPNTVEQA